MLQCKTVNMGLSSIIKSLFGTRKIDSRQALADFLESRSAYLVQKSITEYTQARANMMFSVLLGEKGFKAAYESARWTSYPAGLAMVAEVLAGALRQQLSMPAERAEGLLLNAVATVVAKMKNGGPADGPDWERAKEDAAKALALSRLAQPRPAHLVARDRAREVFDSLPLHAALRKHDFDMFSNTLAFHLTEVATEVEELKLSADLR